MTRSIFALAAGLLLSAAAQPALSAQFKADVEGTKIVVYMTSDKDENCWAEVRFSYKTEDRRVSTRFVCHKFVRKGENVLFCERSDDRFIDLTVDAPVTATCGL